MEGTSPVRNVASRGPSPWPRILYAVRTSTVWAANSSQCEQRSNLMTTATTEWRRMTLMILEWRWRSARNDGGEARPRGTNRTRAGQSWLDAHEGELMRKYETRAGAPRGEERHHRDPAPSRGSEVLSATGSTTRSSWSMTSST